MLRLVPRAVRRSGARRLGGAVLVATCAILPAAGPAQGPCEWQAVHDWRPPWPGALTVTGLCTMPSPGFTIALKRSTPPAADPSTLLLVKEVSAPKGMVAQVLTSTPVAYREITRAAVTRVTILPDDCTIEVRDVR